MNPRTPVRPASRRSFIRAAALGAAYVGSGAGAWAQLADATHGGARKLGVALMGLGLYSRGQLGPALTQTKLCRLSGVITGDRAKGQAWSREYGFPEKNIWNYDTVRQLAGNPDVDIVYVVTPNGLHPEHVIAVAQAGKHVICEKPMANSVADCDAMIRACDKAGVRLSIGYRLVYEPHHIELDRLAREEDFGLLNRLTGEQSWTFGERAWRIEKTLSGGGPLMDVGIYPIQAACRAARGMPLTISARELPKTNPELFNEVEETIEWTMNFPKGVVCNASSSYVRNANWFQAEGDRGWIRIEPAFGYRGIDTTTSRGHLELPNVHQQALQIDDFVDCVLTGRKTPVPGAMGRAHMAIIEAIYRSAAEDGKQVDVAQLPLT